MRLALSNGTRVEALPKLRGQCPQCGEVVVAKCGRHVVWHWAHLSRTHCDPWWESESDWHRGWKARFPIDWQEVVLQDEKTGERHIADVRTSAGLVVEFQRSTITPEEVSARERFYQRIVWVVDGCKNDTDRFNFSNMRERPNQDGMARFHWFGRSALFARWHTLKPVFIDFGPEHGFWRILRFDPKSSTGLAVLVDVESFVELAASGTTDFSAVGGPASIDPPETAPQLELFE